MENVQVILANVYDFEMHLPNILSQITPHYREKYDECKRMQDKLQKAVSGFLLKKYLGVTNDDELSYNEYGKPMLVSKEMCFNLSHSAAYVVLGISDCDLGVDIEKVRTCHDSIVKKVFHPEQQKQIQSLEGFDRDEKFTEIWTQYEAVLKLEGIGLAHGYQNIPIEKYYIHTHKVGTYYISCATEKEARIEIAKEEGKYFT